MLAIRIDTSSPRRLWSSCWWKQLIDALARGGAEHDPRKEHPDLALALQGMVEERDGRFFPTGNSMLAIEDDIALSMVVLRRVERGHENLVVHDAEPWETSEWSSIDVPFFGTIGNSVYERQTKRNREGLAGVFQCPGPVSRLGLAFRLSTNRRDRDIDNLADAIMPFFNKHVRRFSEVCVMKLPPSPTECETLRFHCW